MACHCFDNEHSTFAGDIDGNQWKLPEFKGRYQVGEFDYALIPNWVFIQHQPVDPVSGYVVGDGEYGLQTEIALGGYELSLIYGTLQPGHKYSLLLLVGLDLQILCFGEVKLH